MYCGNDLHGGVTVESTCVLSLRNKHDKETNSRHSPHTAIAHTNLRTMAARQTLCLGHLADAVLPFLGMKDSNVSLVKTDQRSHSSLARDFEMSGGWL